MQRRTAIVRDMIKAVPMERPFNPSIMLKAFERAAMANTVKIIPTPDIDKI